MGFNPFGDSTEAKKKVFRVLGKQLFGEYWGDEVGRQMCADKGDFCACVGTIYYGVDTIFGNAYWTEGVETKGPGLWCNDDLGSPAPSHVIQRKGCKCQDRNNVGSAGGLAVSFSVAQQMWLFLVNNNITDAHPMGIFGTNETATISSAPFLQT